MRKRDEFDYKLCRSTSAYQNHNNHNNFKQEYKQNRRFFAKSDGVLKKLLELYFVRVLTITCPKITRNRKRKNKEKDAKIVRK